MKKKSTFFALLSILSALFLCTCTTGLGTELDLEPPVLTVTHINGNEFVNNQYVPLTFVISGIATDNIGVTDITITYREAGIEKSKKANINGDKWNCEITVSENKEIQFDIVATDNFKNTSAKSKKSITLIVDASSPVVKSITITENKQTNLLQKTDLDTKKIDNSSDKDYFHNENFIINAVIQDNFEVTSSTLKLIDEYSNIIYTVDNSSDNEYSPTFIVNTSDATKFTREGKHYYRPIINAKDKAGNIHENKFEGQYLCWYYESDTPRINIIGASDSNLEIQKGSVIPVSVFDDDAIDTIEYTLITQTAWNSLSGASNQAKINNISNGSFTKKTYSSSGTTDRDATFQYECETAGDYYFVVRVKDKKAGREGKYSYSATKVKVTSQDKPMLIISSPTDNDLPVLTSNNFTLTAYTLDDKAISTLTLTYTVGTGANVKNYSISVPSSSTTTEGSSKKSSFTKTLNIINDFKDKNNNVTNELKRLTLSATDLDGNTVTKTINIPSYTQIPEIQIQFSKTGASGSYSTVTSAYQTEPSILYVKAIATGRSGLAIDDSKTKVTLSKDNGTPTTLSKTGSNGNYSFTIANPNAEGMAELILTSEDILGNVSEKIISISYSPIPALQSVSCESPNNKTFIQGEKIKVMASFSTPVRVNTNNGNSRPYLKLLNATGSEFKNAYYVSGSNTQDLVFEYTVEEGLEVSGIRTPTINAIVIPSGGSIKSVDNVNAVFTNSILSLHQSKTLNIDSKKPTITAYSPERESKANITNNDVEIVLTFSEPIRKDKGYITVQRTKDWAVPIVFTKQDFLAVYNKMNSANRIKMIGSDVLNNYAKDPITSLSKGPYRGMQHGLLDNAQLPEGVKPDTSTKYVLEYSLNPHSTTGDVLGTRQALESVDYHKVKIDVTSSMVTINNNKVTIRTNSNYLGNAFFVEGREFEVTIDDTCFMDNAGNSFNGITEETRNATYNANNAYKFWNGKVATPVIRVNRLSNVSGGNWAKENSPQVPSPITGWHNYAVNNDVRNIKPSGMIDVRIDCETPGATLAYNITHWGIPNNIIEVIISRNSEGDTVTTQNVANGNGSTIGNVNAPTNPSQNLGAFTAINPSTNNPTNSTVSFTVGESSIYKPFRYYINSTATKTGFTQSATGREGAYKTVVMLKNPGSSGGTRKIVMIQGCSIEGGESHLQDFPIKDNVSDPRLTRIAYTVDTDETSGDWNATRDDIPVANWNTSNYRTCVFVSYDFIDDWYMQSIRANYQENENRDKVQGSSDFNKAHCGYGALYFYYGMKYWR